ncbi:hypothetical protein B0H10DRAFT_1974571 [Mycena sp. CBHHK59/15]|nr:hypothetical protein B0H10DRAFT_1974571 [Mycena sp. CBHHK59/15]
MPDNPQDSSTPPSSPVTPPASGHSASSAYPSFAADGHSTSSSISCENSNQGSNKLWQKYAPETSKVGYTIINLHFIASNECSMSRDNNKAIDDDDVQKSNSAKKKRRGLHKTSQKHVAATSMGKDPAQPHRSSRKSAPKEKETTLKKHIPKVTETKPKHK